jgi:hypothetical protein
MTRIMLTAPNITREAADAIRYALDERWPDLDVMILGGVTSVTIVPTADASGGWEDIDVTTSILGEP